MRLVSFNVDGDERPGAVVPGPDRVDRVVDLGARRAVGRRSRARSW
jgi:hypothetical protein